MKYGWYGYKLSSGIQKYVYIFNRKDKRNNAVEIYLDSRKRFVLYDRISPTTDISMMNFIDSDFRRGAVCILFNESNDIETVRKLFIQIAGEISDFLREAGENV